MTIVEFFQTKQQDLIHNNILLLEERSYLQAALQKETIEDNGMNATDIEAMLLMVEIFTNRICVYVSRYFGSKIIYYTECFDPVTDTGEVRN